LSTSVEHQLLDQLPPPRQLEGRDLELEALVELVDGPVHPPTQPPAHGGGEEAIDEGDGGERAGEEGEPERDGYR
jgi:hypothetical protein